MNRYFYVKLKSAVSKFNYKPGAGDKWRSVILQCMSFYGLKFKP